MYILMQCITRFTMNLLSHSPVHSRLPFEHLGQSILCVDHVTFYSILELKQCPRCQVFLKSIQHLSLGNDVTFSDKNIVVVSLKQFYFKILCTIYTVGILKEHTLNKEQKQNFISISCNLSVSAWPKLRIVRNKFHFICRFKGHLVWNCYSNQQINQSRCLFEQHEKKLRSTEHMVFLCNAMANSNKRGCMYNLYILY